MTPQKTPLSARLNRFWANMLTPINAYLGTALIILVLAMTLAGLTGGQMGGHVEISVMRDGGGHPHGWGAGLFGLVLAVGLAALTGLVARLIQIEGHLAAIRQAMEAGSVAPAVSAASELSAKKARNVKAKVKKKTKSP
jgi:hypothetical protein